MNRVILVGASNTLLKNKLGKTIDSFDIVCRINSGGRSECLTGEYKDIIGSKTNILLGKHIGILKICENSNIYDEIIYFHKNSEIIEKCKQTLHEFNKFNSRPTSGMLSIFYLLDIYNKISICGFDGFKEGHWYGNKFIDNQNDSDKIAAKGLGAHNAIKESEYIEYLIKNNKINRIDE